MCAVAQTVGCDERIVRSMVVSPGLVGRNNTASSLKFAGFRLQIIQELRHDYNA